MLKRRKHLQNKGDANMQRFVYLFLSLAMVLGLSGCAGGGTAAAAAPPAGAGTAETLPADTAEDLAQDAADAAVSTQDGSGGYSVGFVTFGLGGDFFQQLADAFKAKMTALGWEADYTDGKFDPTAQIEACENYIAMGVDVIVLWSVAPEAMSSVIEQAMAQGIKLVAFVAATEKYDVLMVADNADLAESCALLAAKWIDAIYADADDHSVPVAVFTDRTADTGVVQGDVLLKIEEYSQKALFVTEVECGAEDTNTGMAKAETLYISNPEIKVFLTAHNGLALGINNYFTSISSPVTDYSDMGIYTINGDNAVAEIIKASANNEAPLRGMVLTGSVNDTAEEIAGMLTGIMDGSVPSGFIQQAGTTFVNADTVDEYLETGSVKSVTKADFE
jgi:ABC-type sugar transport system substrate-binding protein